MNRALAAAVVTAVVLTPSSEASDLKVHEWGTFASVAGDRGAALEWRPLAGEDDLPLFVHRSQDTGLRGTLPRKSDIAGTVRMETPVVYFYADAETEASL